jgi:hypothetical protein
MWFTLGENDEIDDVKNKLTSASIVARRGIVKLVLDILASVSVAKTFTSSDD